MNVICDSNVNVVKFLNTGFPYLTWSCMFVTRFFLCLYAFRRDDYFEPSKKITQFNKALIISPFVFCVAICLYLFMIGLSPGSITLIIACGDMCIELMHYLVKFVVIYDHMCFISGSKWPVRRILCSKEFFALLCLMSFNMLSILAVKYLINLGFINISCFLLIVMDICNGYLTLYHGANKTVYKAADVVLLSRKDAFAVTGVVDGGEEGILSAYKKHLKSEFTDCLKYGRQVMLSMNNETPQYLIYESIVEKTVRAYNSFLRRCADRDDFERCMAHATLCDELIKSVKSYQACP